MAETNSTQGRATKAKSTFRMDCAVSINIQAPPTLIWKLLTTAGDFPRWNSTVKSMEGTIAQGEKIKLKATIAPERTFNLKINEFRPGLRTICLSQSADSSDQMIELVLRCDEGAQQRGRCGIERRTRGPLQSLGGQRPISDQGTNIVNEVRVPFGTRPTSFNEASPLHRGGARSAAVPILE